MSELFGNDEVKLIEKYDDLNKLADNIASIIIDTNKSDLDKITRFFDNMYPLATRYMIIRGQMGIGNNKNLDLISSAILKGLNNIQAIVDLNIHGRIGAARILMRNVFEFLVIAKFASVSNSDLIRKKWENNVTINLNKDVFDMIIYPNNQTKDEFMQLWSILCQQTHATRVSGQIGLPDKEVVNDIHVNFSLVFILLFMIYHLFNRYLSTQYLRNYIASLPSIKSGINGAIDFVSNPIELKEIVKLIKQEMSSKSKQVVQYYISSWKTGRKIVQKNEIERLDIPENSINDCQIEVPKVLIQSKSEILSRIHKLIIYYKKESSEYKEPYRLVLIKNLVKLSASVKSHEFPILHDDRLFFDISIKNDRIELALYYCTEKEDESSDHCMSAHQVDVFLISKCNYLTVEQYADLHNVSYNTVRNWIRKTQIRSAKDIDDQVLIPELTLRPTRSFIDVYYSISQITPWVYSRFPYLKGGKSLYIFSINRKRMYLCRVTDKNGKVKRELEIDNQEREKIELTLHKLHTNFEELGAEPTLILD